MDPFLRWSFLLRSVQKAWRRCWPTFSLVLPTLAVQFRWMSCDVSSTEFCYRNILMLRSLKNNESTYFPLLVLVYFRKNVEFCVIWGLRTVVDEEMTVLRNMMLCSLRHHNTEECNALLKVSQYWGMWRSVNEDITVLRNMTLCSLRHHNVEECDAVLRVSQFWGMWRSVNDDITVLRNMTLCSLRHHNVEECDGVLRVSQYWGMWRSVNEDITVLRNMTLH